jgi:hypothetical protein
MARPARHAGPGAATGVDPAGHLAYGGLIAIGIVLVQPFVAGASLDISGTICAVAFAIAIPLLAALVLVNRQETFRRRRTSSRIVAVARAIAQASAFVGVVAGFWHIHCIAGVGGASERPRGGRGPVGGDHAPGTRRAAGVPGRGGRGAREARRRRRVAPHRGGDRQQRLTGEHLLYGLKAGPAGGLRPSSGPATTRRSPRTHSPFQQGSREQHTGLSPPGLRVFALGGIGLLAEPGDGCTLSRRATRQGGPSHWISEAAAAAARRLPGPGLRGAAAAAGTPPR